jgi:hypothetical protein
MSDPSRDDDSPPTTPPTDRVMDRPLVPLYDMLRPPQAPGELGRLGGHRILARLGAGGMGQVFRAESPPPLQRLVALKVIHADRVADSHARARFLREMEALASVHHQHVVPLYQAGEDGPTLFFTMEQLHGASLWQVLHHGGGFVADLASAVRICRQIAEGLEAIHAAGFVHRDLKPSNVWLRTPKTADGVDVARASGWVLLLDFGLARALAPAQGAPGLTRSGAAVGTFGYMAPEQAAGGQVDHRADLYSLGAILDEMLHGPRTKDMTGSPLPVLPPKLTDLVGRLLQHRPEQRPAFAETVAATLHEVETELARSPAGEVDLRLTIRRRRDGVPAEALASTAGVVPARTRGMKVVSRPPGRPVVRSGETIRVEVSANQRGYLTVFNLGPDGNLDRLYPAEPHDEKAPAAPLEANHVQHVADVMLAPPAGVEKLAAVWSDTPRNLTEDELLRLLQQGGPHVVTLELDHQP